MKLWYQSGVNFAQHPAYRKALERRFADVASAGTVVTLAGGDEKFQRGLPLADCISSPYAYHMTYVPMFFDALRQAEASGHDAFLMGSLSEPALREMRSLAGIPVVSLSECALLTALSVAPRVGLVALSAKHGAYNRKSVEAHRLESRVSGIHAMEGSISEHELERQFDAPGSIIERFEAAARAAMASGADAIIPAEGLLAVLLATHKVFQLDGVPVIDVVASGVLYSEFMVNMRQRAGLEQSRSAYPRPSAAVLATFG